tara:strand:- start:511 stop:810 length:300 start_codon:yes stop_codon:yes gene_type:complete
MKKYSEKGLIKDLEQGNKLYLYFSSGGCGPCKEVKSSVEIWAPKQNIVYLINSEEAIDLQKELSIVGYPTIAVIENKKLLELAQGSEQILELINGKSNK